MATAWVIKLGGSLYGTEPLARWPQALARADALVVPGGGPFAEQVRAAQRRHGFDDRAAHVMAILAMAQYGTLLAALDPGLATASRLDALAAVAQAGGAAVWLPDPAQLPATDIPASWDVTSDSLAAWLAGRLGIARLLLVKSAPFPTGAVTAAECAGRGWVDSLFPRFLTASRAAAWLCGPEAYSHLEEALRSPDRYFTRIIALDQRDQCPAR